MLSSTRAYLTWFVIAALLLPVAYAALPVAGGSSSVLAPFAMSPPPLHETPQAASGAQPDAAAAPTSTTPSLAASTPQTLVGWDALHFGTNNNISNGWVPPDPILSVSPTYVVEMVNLLMGVYTQTGTQLNVSALSDLFRSGGDSISDPKVQYDTSSGRWFASVTDISSSSILLAVSSSATPLGSWHRFTITGSGCLDQPILGVGTSTVIVSANVFSSCTSKSITYIGAEYWVISKSDLLSGVALPAMSVVGPDVNEFSIHPAQIQGASPDHYMISTYRPGSAITSTVLHLFTVSGTPPSKVNVTVTSLSMPTAAVPPSAPQLGSRNTVDTGDIRIADAAWSAGTLWFGFDEACPSTASRACIRLGAVSTSNDTLLQDFDIDVSGKDVFYPGIRADGTGSLAVVFGFSSSTDYPGLMVGGRLAGDAPNTLRQMQTVNAGSGPESPPNCSGTCRYGDYFGAALDPGNASRVWLAGEEGTPSGWSTHILSVALKAQLTVSYRVLGGGTGYAPPELSYVSWGQTVGLTLSPGANTVLADPGTEWAMSALLPGSSTTRGEIWALNATAGSASGWANTSAPPPLAFDYYHQFAASLSFAVVGSAGFAASPQVTAVRFGVARLLSLPATVYLDANSSYSYPTSLAGSTNLERWTTSLPGNGTMSAPLDLALTFYHQALMTFEFTVVGTIPSSAPQVHFSKFGAATSAALNATVWADSPSRYAYDEALSGAGAYVRWGAGPNGNGTVVTSGTVSVLYRKQFLVSLAAEPSALISAIGGAGWYDAGTLAVLSVTAAAAAGWRFDAWSGDVTGTSSSLTFTVQRPMNITATFDAGLTITAGDGGSISYSYGATSGTVNAGSSVTIYVPVGTVVTLSASAGSLTNAFAGWSGSASGAASTTTVQVVAPGVVTANFGLNVAVVAGLAIAAVAVVAGVAAVAVARRRRRPPA